MCEPTEPCTESEAGGSTVSFVQRSRCVRFVSYRLREVDLFPTYSVLINALASIVLTSVVSYKAAGR